MSKKHDGTTLSLFAKEKHDWIKNARLVAKRIALQKGSVTADDIWEEFPPMQWWKFKNCMAAVFKGNGLKCVNYVKSRRKECHHRPIGVFVLP